jgi:hypothetical protein
MVVPPAPAFSRAGSAILFTHLPGERLGARGIAKPRVGQIAALVFFVEYCRIRRRIIALRVLDACLTDADAED